MEAFLPLIQAWLLQQSWNALTKYFRVENKVFTGNLFHLKIVA